MVAKDIAPLVELPTTTEGLERRLRVLRGALRTLVENLRRDPEIYREHRVATLDLVEQQIADCLVLLGEKGRKQ